MSGNSKASGKKECLSRRQFLQKGGDSAVGYVFLPSLATILHNQLALAKDNVCKKEANAGSGNMPAFVAIDLRGGGNIAGNNVIVYDKDGRTPLNSYTGLGLVDALHPKNNGMVNTELGLPFHTHSGILRGIKEVVSSTAVLNRVNGCVICTQSADDTSSNKLASAPGIFLAGSKGTKLPLVGTSPSLPNGSGGNSISGFTTGVTPTYISSIYSINEIFGPNYYWQEGQLQGALKLINSMSDLQIKRFARLGLSEQKAAMIRCGYLNAGETLVLHSQNPSASPLDPRSDGSGVPSNTIDRYLNNNNVSEAAVETAFLALKGFAGAGTIALGGYDYHDGTATTGEAKDVEAGRVIGMVLDMAAALQKKVMIHVYTDGGVDGNGTAEIDINGARVPKAVWTGDAEVRSAAFVLVYDPSGAPVLDFQQMGAFKSATGGSVDINPGKHNRISQDPYAQASVVVANWLAWQGRQSEFSSIIFDSPVPSAKIDDYLFIKT